MRQVPAVLGSILITALPLAGITVSSAQVPPGSSEQLQEVVVTAERRAENLQEVPISMTAITGATLESFGDKSFNDYAEGIPNLAFTSGAGAGGNGNGFGVSSTRAIAIRGVYGNNTTGFYLNDTPIPMSLDPRVVDIDHIEILRGPQGTLFGQGSMGGTVRLVTREPQLDRVAGRVEAEGSYVEKGGGGYSTDGTVNLPLVADSVGLRVSVFSAFDPGLYTRTWGGPLDPRSPVIPLPPGAPVGEKDNVGATQWTGVSASLKIVPTFAPGLALTPIFMWQHTTSNGYPMADYTANNFTQTRPLDVPEAVEDEWSFAGLTAIDDLKFGKLILSGTYFYRGAYDREDSTDINSIVYYQLPYYVAAPLDNWLNTKTWTGEGRFESNFQGPVQFVLGVFSSLSERRYREYFYVPGLNAASGGSIGTDLEYTQDTPNADRERAVFIDVSYTPIKAVQLSAGVRSAYLDHEGAYTANGPLNGGPSGPPATYSEHSERDTAPRFTAKYEFAPDQMIYASAAKGFRIGGTNSLLPPPCLPDLAALGLQNGAPIESDSLWSYEVGSKNTFSDNRVRSRLAFYWIDWNRIQQTVFLPCTYNVYANSGAAQSKGTELELDLIPLEGLTLNLGVGYENAKITEATAASRTIVGQPLNGVPKWSGSASAQYSVPLDGSWSGFVRAQYTYTGDRVSFINVAPADGGRPLGSYGLFNLRIGADQGPSEITLYVENLFNELGIIGDLLPEGAELPSRPRFFVTRPRTFGLQLRRSF